MNIRTYSHAVQRSDTPCGAIGELAPLIPFQSKAHCRGISNGITFGAQGHRRRTFDSPWMKQNQGEASPRDSAGNRRCAPRREPTSSPRHWKSGLRCNLEVSSSPRNPQSGRISSHYAMFPTPQSNSQYSGNGYSTVLCRSLRESETSRTRRILVARKLWRVHLVTKCILLVIPENGHAPLAYHESGSLFK